MLVSLLRQELTAQTQVPVHGSLDDGHVCQLSAGEACHQRSKSECSMQGADDCTTDDRNLEISQDIGGKSSVECYNMNADAALILNVANNGDGPQTESIGNAQAALTSSKIIERWPTVE